MNSDIPHETDTKRSRRVEFLLKMAPQTLIDVCRMRNLYQTNELAPGAMRQQLELLIESQTENETVGSCNDQRNNVNQSDTAMNSKESCEDYDNELIKTLIQEIQSLNDQLKSYAAAALDLGQEQSKKYQNQLSRLSSTSTDTERYRSVGKRNQNRKMRRKDFLNISWDSSEFNVEDLSIKKACPALHSPLKENPDRYKRPRGKMKSWWNIFLFLDCLTLQVEIVVADREFNVQIYLLKQIHPAFCSTLAKGLHENRVIESSDRNVRGTQPQTYLCPDESGRKSSNVMENCNIKQEKREPSMLKAEKILPKDRRSTASTTKSENKVWRLFELFMVWLVMATLFGSGYAAQLDTKVSNTEMVQSKQLLRTDTCNDETLYNLKRTCQITDELRNHLIDFCMFRGLCQTDEKPVCLDTQDTGVFVCLKKDLKCAKGYLIKATMDVMNPDSVHLQILKCPKGSFQSHDSDCVNACYEMHRDLEIISEKYIVYSEGDNVSPAEVYCNYREGHFSREGRFLLDYDLEEKNNPSFCVHTSQYQQCKVTQYPLPNGTCSESCEDGYFRDDHDDFKCKPIQERQVPSSNFVTEVTVGNDQEEETLTTIKAVVDYEKISTPVKIVLGVCGTVFMLIVLLCRKQIGHNCTLPFCNRERRAGGYIETAKHRADGDGSVELDAKIDMDGIDDSFNTGNGDIESRCLSEAVGYKTPLLTKNGVKQVLPKTDCENVSLQPKITRTDDSNKIQVQPQGEPYDKGEPFKKPFDNTLNQYAMEHHTKLMQSVGALVVKQRPLGTPKRAGTVFRTGGQLLMTARHVIKSIVDPENTGNTNWLLLESDDVYVNFNASLINDARIKYRFECICISDDPNLDFAILKVLNPTQLPLKMLLHKFDYERLNAKQLSIIGFGHTTEHNDKCIDPRCQILSPDSDRVLEAKKYVTEHREDFLELLRNQSLGDYSMVDRSYLGIDRRNNIIVDCFMEHGASGAPAVSPCGKVVGILTHGLPELFFKLPEHNQKVFPPEHRFEIVLKMQYIYNYLKEYRPDLADDIFE